MNDMNHNSVTESTHITLVENLNLMLIQNNELNRCCKKVKIPRIKVLLHFRKYLCNKKHTFY